LGAVIIWTGEVTNLTITGLESLLEATEKNAVLAEESGKLPDNLVRSLHQAGLFRALIPKQFGGLELAFDDYLDIVKRLAQSDASTAWCVNQSAVIAITTLWLHPDVISQIWSDPRTSIANGPPYNCNIERKAGDYTLDGHWGFSSGCQHATWMTGPARLPDNSWRSGFFRPDQVEFVDNWKVAGLKATGSFQFKVNHLVIPESQVVDFRKKPSVTNTMTLLPISLLFAVSFAAVALGLAKGALSDVIKIAQGKKPKWASLRLSDDPDVQRFLGKAMARWRAADAYLASTSNIICNEIKHDLSVSYDQRAQLRMAGTHIIQECAEIVDTAYKISGSSGIYQDETLQRRFQDMHVITQHVQGRESYFGLLGRYAISGNYETGPMS
jgi:indole-3-acetate monooxygenase